MIVEGVVIRGRGEGEKLGFPTINVPAGGAALPSGIFAGRAWLNPQSSTFGFQPYSAALYIPDNRSMVEAHLLNFSGDVYGANVRIEILQKIRDIADFASKDEARRTIASDIEKVKDFFTRRSPLP